MRVGKIQTYTSHSLVEIPSSSSDVIIYRYSVDGLVYGMPSTGIPFPVSQISDLVTGSVAEIQGLAGNYVAGRGYLVSDASKTNGGVILSGVDSNNLSLKGNAIFKNADYSGIGNYSDIEGITGVPFASQFGVFSFGDSPAIGDVVIFEEFHYQKITADAPTGNPGTDVVNFSSVLAKNGNDVGYIVAINEINYRISNNSLISRNDGRYDNEINSASYDTFQWGNPAVSGIKTIGQNSVISLLGNKGNVSGTLGNNSFLSIVSNSLGADVRFNINGGSSVINGNTAVISLNIASAESAIQNIVSIVDNESNQTINILGSDNTVSLSNIGAGESNINITGSDNSVIFDDHNAANTSINLLGNTNNVNIAENTGNINIVSTGQNNLLDVSSNGGNINVVMTGSFNITTYESGDVGSTGNWVIAGVDNTITAEAFGVGTNNTYMDGTGGTTLIP